eukprot:scaffold28116_cov51-Phaeocystis_antarctica.AAC.2
MLLDSSQKFARLIITLPPRRAAAPRLSLARKRREPGTSRGAGHRVRASGREARQRSPFYHRSSSAARRRDVRSDQPEHGVPRHVPTPSKLVHTRMTPRQNRANPHASRPPAGHLTLTR